MTRLQQLRIECRLKPEALAAKAGVGTRTVRRLEGGAPSAYDQTLWRLADALTAELRIADKNAPAVDPLELLREVEPASPSSTSRAA